MARHATFLMWLLLLTEAVRLRLRCIKSPLTDPTTFTLVVFIPPHTFKSIAHSQVTRYRRICSTEEETNRNLRELKDTFINLNYPKILIDKQISSANKPTRQDLLSYRDKPKNDRTPLVVTYHPCLRKLRNIVSTLQPILESDAALNSAVGGRPLLAYRQPPNLRHLLVSSKMSSNSRPTPNITVPCEVKRCKLCKHINSSQTIDCT